MIPWSYDILDISQPIGPETACFPGDVPFQQSVSLTLEASQVLNLSAFTMSPHVGTHADAPLHISGSFQDGLKSKTHPTGANSLPLSAYIGPAEVVHLTENRGPIAPEDLPTHFWQQTPFPERVLFYTHPDIAYDRFDSDYAHLTPTLIEALAKKGVQLVGLDGPSVDAVDAKTLESHHTLLKHHMCWLENLSLKAVPAGHYILVALPLAFQQLDASPVRAILLRPKATPQA